MKSITDYAGLVKEKHALNTTIAPTITSLVATKAYVVGEKFIYDGILYKTTSAISQNANIVLSGTGKNATADDNIASQISNVKQALSDEVETRATLGAHNLMPLTIERLKANNAGGTWTGNNYAIHGITFAIATDNDGNVTSITLSGATTTDVALLYLGEITPQHGSYIISSFPEGESHTGCSALYRIYSSASSYNDVYVPTQSTIEYTGVKIVAYICRISPGITISTPVVYYPMLRVSKDSLKDFTPYAMTNRELTENKAEKSDLTNINITGTTNSTGATIASGTYFYLNGVLVKAKTGIANGATLTSGTNYENVTTGSLNQLQSLLNSIFGVTGSSPSPLSCTSMKFSGTDDYFMQVKETGDEDYKGIQIKDKNDNIRYSLTFKNGHLFFYSKDASGNMIVNETQII